MRDHPLSFRCASQEDLPAMVRMLADDLLGASRELCSDPLAAGYLRAFAAIKADLNNELVVACMDEEVVGMLQLTFIPSLTYQGSWRALIEGVRIDTKFRARGFGTALLQWAIARARVRGCCMVQLTTDKSRVDACRFYQALGFKASHEGLKLYLT